MSSFYADLASFFPLTQTPLSALPEIGSLAPSFHPTPADGAGAGELTWPLEGGRSGVLVFVRHLGCPFCQKEIEEMDRLGRENPDIQFILVSQSTLPIIQEYLSNTPRFPTPPSFHIIPSPPPHSLYSLYAIPQLSTSGVLGGTVMSSVKRLASEEGIKNTTTHGTRWLSSGAFAVDGEGRVRWRHVARGSDEVSDLEEAVRWLREGEGKAKL